MANTFILPFRSNNAALPINNISVHPIQSAIAAYYDMQTFADDGVTMLDQSGNGKHAVFNARPEIDLEGLFFRGGHYAITPLAAPAVRAVAVVVRLIDIAAITAGGYLLSNWGEGVGTLLTPFFDGASQSWQWSGQIGTGGPGGKSTDTAPMQSERWEVRYMRVTADGRALVKNLAAGTTGTETNPSTVPARNWVIGSSWGFEDGTQVQPAFNMQNVKSAAVVLLNRVLSLQEEAWLVDHERTKARLRGVRV